jgi:hypothetical protein
MLFYAPAPALVVSGDTWSLLLPLAKAGTGGAPTRPDGIFFHSSGVYAVNPKKTPKVHC